MSGPSTHPDAGARMTGWRIPGLVLMQLLPRTWRKSRREGMIENRPGLTLVSHVVLAIGIAIVDAATGGGPAQATSILVYKVYHDGFKGLDLGGSAAQSVVLMLIVVALTVVQFRYVERKVQY